jgi:hypothetical protein
MTDRKFFDLMFLVACVMLSSVALFKNNYEVAFWFLAVLAVYELADIKYGLEKK